MRILHVTPSLDRRVGGPPHVVLGYCKALVKKGLDATIYTTDLNLGRKKNKSRSFFAIQEGIKIHYFKYKRPYHYLYSPELRDALENNAKNFDIVHIHGIWIYPVAITASICMKYKIPYLVRVRGSLLPYALRYRKATRLIKALYSSIIERKILNNATAVHCMKKQEIIALRSFKVHTPAFVVRSGVDIIETATIESSKEIFASRYPKLAGKRILLYMGRISPIKGMDRLCESFYYVLKEFPNAHLIIAGPDNEGYARKLHRWLIKKNIFESVTFTGFLSGKEKLSVYANAEIFCLASYQEAHSMALNEAMICKLPIVVTRSASIDEIEAENAGIVVDGNPKAISQAILTLLTREELRKRLGENGRRFASNHLSWDTVTDNLIKEYKKIMRC